MAEDLSQPDIVVPAAERRAFEPIEPSRREGGSYRFRFALVYVALALFAGAALGATLLLVSRPGKEAEPAWSKWQPTGRPSSFPTQIADYVSGRYRLASGKALVGVIAGTPKVRAGEEEVPVRAVAIQDDPEGASEDIRIVPTDNGVMYELCGLGPRCSIAEGRPSKERHQLIRREALELALYTFKYVEGTDSVIALLPLNPQADAATALFFQKKEFRKELEQPLQRTLRRANPPRPAEIDPREGSIIDRLTEQRLFSYEFQPAQAGGAILVLAPVTG